MILIPLHDKELERVVKTLKESGFLLEVSVMKILEQHGFFGSERHYLSTSKDGVASCQIDAVVHSHTYSFGTGEKDLGGFRSDLIVECKEFDGNYLIFLPLSKLDEGNAVLRMPYFYCGENLVTFVHQNSCGILGVKKLLGFDHFSKNIRNLNKAQAIEDDKKGVYGACDQLLRALDYFVRLDRNNAQLDAFSVLNSTEQSAVLDYAARTLNGDDKRLEIDRILSENLFDRPLYFSVYFPIVVVSNSTKIFIPNIQNENISDFKEVNSFVYLYIPSHGEKFDTVLNKAWHLPIIVCKESELGAVADSIKSASQKIADNINSNLKINPTRLREEFVDLIKEKLGLINRNIIFSG